jgi:hypothetical protein
MTVLGIKLARLHRMLDLAYAMVEKKGSDPKIV